MHERRPRSSDKKPTPGLPAAGGAAPEQSRVGQQVAGYRITHLIGQGGMGSVYLAEHGVEGRKAAIKILRRVLSEDEVMVARFINEARAAQSVRHPNIIDILEVGRMEDGVPYLVMEYLEGETLGERLQRLKRLSLAETLAIVEPAARGLAAAHERKIVHRDLKPENVFIVGGGRTTKGQREQVKVLDFGVAKLLDDASGTVKTGGALLGTPLYMAPEQCRGTSDQVDARTDVYALGTMVYEMLCGCVPFQSEACGEILVMKLTQAPRPPRAVVPELPPAVEAVILRALEKEPSARYGSVVQMLRALTRAAREAGAAAVEAVAPSSAGEGDVGDRTSAARSSSVTPQPLSSGGPEAAAPRPVKDPASTGARRTRLIVAGSLALLGLSAASIFTSSAPPPSPAPPAAAPAAAVVAAPAGARGAGPAALERPALSGAAPGADLAARAGAPPAPAPAAPAVPAPAPAPAPAFPAAAPAVEGSTQAPLDEAAVPGAGEPAGEADGVAAAGSLPLAAARPPGALDEPPLDEGLRPAPGDRSRDAGASARRRHQVERALRPSRRVGAFPAAPRRRSLPAERTKNRRTRPAPADGAWMDRW